MPCSICNNYHLSVLGFYAVSHGITSRDAIKTAAQIAEVLHAANVRAFEQRHGVHGEVAFAFDERALNRAYTPVQIIRAGQFLEYQSNKGHGWEHSEALYLLKRIIKSAIRELPGYEEAERELRPEGPTACRANWWGA